MIKDFFSHKIHSSSNNWPDKLVDLAHIFHEFDGQLYDRSSIAQRLLEISPRSSSVARDPSKFRDEYSAYPAYFGLYRLEPSAIGWLIVTNETTKRFLLKEEPDVPTFLRLQLALFQYPNGMGAAYYPRTNNLRLQANTSQRTLKLINSGVHLSPLRLVVSGLMADAQLRQIELSESSITFDEVFALANDPSIYTSTNINYSEITNSLQLVRDGAIHPPHNYEKRLHLLKHLDLFKIGRGSIAIRESVNLADKLDVESKLRAIAQIDNEFTAFDHIQTHAELETAIQEGGWSIYFDGAKTIRREIVQILSTDLIDELNELVPVTIQPPIEHIPTIYPLQRREQRPPKPVRQTRQREFADPEVTKIRRQRRNLIHKIIVDRMDSLLRDIGAEPMESQHIDLYATLPNDGAFIFEMKSGGKNLLAQIRKGLSQLYEYRFRYRETLKQPVTLCLVLAEEPKNLPWIQEYLCLDRKIALCWFESDGKLIYPSYCADQMQNLIVDPR